MFGKDCSGKCPKLANYITIKDNEHHCKMDWSFNVACFLLSTVLEKEASSNQIAKNNAGGQLAIEPPLWPKPTDFVTGPALKRGMMLQHSLRLWKEVANLEQACTQGEDKT